MKHFQHSFACWIVLGLFSCGKSQKSQKSEVILGPLVMEISPDDSLVKARGIDSYVTYLINSKKDTFNIEYGHPGIIYSLYTASPPVFPLSSRDRIIRDSGKLPPPDDVVFSDYPKEDYDQRIFEKTYCMYDTI